MSAIFYVITGGKKNKGDRMVRLNEKKICKEYQTGAKQVDLAKKYGVEKFQIRAILVKHKIPIRTRPRPIKLILVTVIIAIILVLILQYIALL